MTADASDALAVQSGALVLADGRKLELHLCNWEWRMLAWLKNEAKVDIATVLARCLTQLPEETPSQIASWYIERWYVELGLLPERE